jgi:hypothetical protein
MQRAAPVKGGSMRKSLFLLGAAAVAVVLATSAFAENRGVSFTPIGFHPQPGPNPASSVTAMNPDGTVFLVNPALFGNYCIEWTRENGWGTQIGESTSTCRISSGGAVMGTGRRYGQPPNEPTPPRDPSYVYGWPGTWTGVENEWSYLNPPSDYVPCGTSRLSFYDMGGEGDYATGLSWVTGCQGRAFVWDKATNTSIDLGSPNNRSTRGNAVTADGSSVIGWGTMAQGLRRAGRWDSGTFSWLGDPNGEEPKECAGSGRGCTSNSGSASSGCPGEYVDDGSCQNRGTCNGRGTCQNRGVCTANVCVGGTNPGTSCTSNTQCRGACGGGTNDGTTCNSDTVCSGACTGGTNPGTTCTSNTACAGTCVGPNAGANCTSDSACPDTLVCINNPNWNDSLFKGEAYDVTDDGLHACGRNFDGNANWNTGWISNPDGSFTPIPPPASFPDFVDPFRISQDAKTVVGRVGNPFFGSIPFFWNEGMGTQDLQVFMLGQGLDELFFWELLDLYDVSANGKVMGGRGINPDGLVEGFIIDISKVWICHMPPGQPENARTLGVNSDNVGNHLAHGDFLGTCEFLNSGGLSRAAELRERLDKGPNASMDPHQFENVRSSWNGPATPTPKRVKIAQESTERGAQPKLSRARD